MPRLTEKFVDACLKLADSEKGKLSDAERQLFGPSSIKVKCLLNNFHMVIKTYPIQTEKERYLILNL